MKENITDQAPSFRLSEKEMADINKRFADNPLFGKVGEPNKDLEYFHVTGPDNGWYKVPKRSHMAIEWEDGKNERVPIEEVIAARLANPEIIDIKEAVRSFRKQNRTIG